MYRSGSVDELIWQLLPLVHVLASLNGSQSRVDVPVRTRHVARQDTVCAWSVGSSVAQQ